MSAPAITTDLQPFTPKDGITIKDQIADYRTRVEATLQQGVDERTYPLLAQLSLDGAAMVKDQIRPYWEPDVQAAFRLHRSLTAKREADIALVGDVVRLIDQGLIAYRLEEKRKADIEAARKAAEEKRQQDAVALEQAAELAAQGETDQAEAVIADAIATPAPYVPATAATPKVPGLSFVTDYEFDIEAPHLVPRDLCVPQPSLIKARIKATGGQVAIPGVRIRKVERPVKRGAN